MKKSVIMTVCAALMAAGATAQHTDTFHKNNVFVTAGVNTEAWMNTDGYITAAGKVGAGIWINPWLGLKLEGLAGNTHLLEESRGQVFGGSLTYMAHLYGGKKYRAFNLNGVLGAGFYHYRFGSILKNYTYMNVVAGHLGVQAVYNFSPKWSVYVEPGVTLQPKYYDVKHKDDLAVSAYLSAGVTFSFNDLFDNISRTPTMKVSSEEFDRLNREVNEMREEIDELKQQLEERQQAEAGKKVVMEPLQEMPAVSIGFDAMGDYLSAAERDKLKDIGLWMQDHPNSISVVPFGDSKADNALDNELKQRRAAAIVQVLTEEYGIDSKRIRTATAEEMGYVNKMQAAALIIFLTE